MQGNIFSKELPIAPVVLDVPSREAVASQALAHSKMFHKQSSLFTRGQAQRNLFFLTQLHRFHQAIASLDMRAQLSFQEQQQTFDQQLSVSRLSQTTQFGAFLEQADQSFTSSETTRKYKFQDAQVRRGSTFEGSQKARQATFESTCKSVRKSAVEREATRAREFLVWKEKKGWEMERRVKEWQRSFAEEERRRDRAVEDLKAK